MRPFEYFRPTTLKEASELLVRHGENAHILNGGTDLIIRMRDGLTLPEAVIDLKGIESLFRIREDQDTVTIGAAVTLNRVGGDETIGHHFPYLAAAACSVGSKQVRNRATCIGNLCNASPLADTATPLMVLDAVLEVFGPEGEREIPIREFFVFVRKTSLKPGEIVKGVRIPKTAGMGVFSKLARRKEVDLSTVCMTLLKAEDGWRLSYGAVAPTPVRLPETEALLNQGAALDAILEQAAWEVKPIDDVRASAAYRRDMVKVMLKRGLEQIEKGGAAS
ncbi:FAD binding domain-containing protein [Acidaminobacter hydrogenoformans]|uniref:Carbon-monoxide dehydrogenase medium subunit n=1 Tax=Acidaminobacter hydrogenoformans DSM 2784 TaxID=1120920 RepID=A0A1G5RXS5_9FIRM|nr:xanthine dehydrogenase family protein subunit M [Acidaminobacter hydrogenoformans]SCZ78261.1 carbon-monoxide dehydrogenase medium subunit [Acidaminobacter hydrogenoformans DSM 2784]